VPKHVRVNALELAASPARATILAKSAVVNGAALGDEHKRRDWRRVSSVALRGRGVERAHRIRNTLNGAVAHANFVVNFQNSFASP
jgi:hypothetical protein